MSPEHEKHYRMLERRLFRSPLYFTADGFSRMQIAHLWALKIHRRWGYYIWHI